MILALLMLLNSMFSNNLDIGNDFYQLPNYNENSYKEVFALNIDDSLNIDLDSLVLKTYFQIYEPLGFDSMIKKSYGLANNILQATQFQLDFRIKNIELSLGRILNFEEYDFYSVDGVRLKFYFNNFSFSILHGKEINENSFLGRIDFYDEENRNILDYDINSLNLSVFYNNINSISLKYIEYKNNDYLEYQSLNTSIDINFWKISSINIINYLLTRGDFERLLLSFEIYNTGIEYEEYKPFFFNDSIFNIFVIEKYRRASLYYNNKLVNISVFSENFDYYGGKISIKLFKKYNLSSEYLYKEHFYLSLRAVFNEIELFLNYFHEKTLDSIAFRSSYTHELLKISFVKFYGDFIYNNYYKFQMRVGILLSSEF